jgi:hypothetical protein
MSQQLSLFNEHTEPLKKDVRSGTFIDNMKLPVHRWFRYSAGFSAEWAASVINQFSPMAVLDPFAGSGTSLIASEQCNVLAYGFESHPFVARIAKAKLKWNTSTGDLINASKLLINYASNSKVDCDNVPDLIFKCYNSDTLKKLFALKNAFHILSKDFPDDINDITWLAITSILRKCSFVGTAQWQYILPNKTKAKVSEPFLAFETKFYDIIQDMLIYQKSYYRNDAIILKHDARVDCEQLENKIDFVITSPPYPNNYDYADATRLEMCFWGEIEKWADLQLSVRQYIYSFLLTACHIR